MSRRKLHRLVVFTSVMATITVLIYTGQSRRVKQKAEIAAQMKQQAEQAVAQQRQKEEKESAAVKAAQTAAREHQLFLNKYVDAGIAKKAGNPMVAVAVSSENNSMNHAIGVALINRFQTGHVQLTDSFFKPELITDGLFNSVFNRSSDVFGRLELANSLDALLLARQNVQYETNTDLANIITANMSLEIVTLPVAGQSQSQSWTFSANGTGFRQSEARKQAEERIINQITTDNKMSLGL